MSYRKPLISLTVSNKSLTGKEFQGWHRIKRIVGLKTAEAQDTYSLISMDRNLDLEELSELYIYRGITPELDLFSNIVLRQLCTYASST